MDAGGFTARRPEPSGFDTNVLGAGLDQYVRSQNLALTALGLWVVILLAFPFLVAILSSPTAPPGWVFELGIWAGAGSFLLYLVVFYALGASASAWTAGDQALAQLPSAAYRDDGQPTPSFLATLAYATVVLGIVGIVSLASAGASAGDLALYPTVLTVASVVIVGAFGAAGLLLWLAAANCAHVLRSDPSADPRRIARSFWWVRSTAWFAAVPGALFVAGAATNYVDWQIALIGLVGVLTPIGGVAGFLEARTALVRRTESLRAELVNRLGAGGSTATPWQLPPPPLS